MSKLTYRPEIDGLRAIAVIVVVFFHLGLGFNGGFVGVDIFFVISGFLITRIITRGLESDNFSLAEFWERRVKRIFPALIVVVFASLAAGYWLLDPAELKDLGESSIAQALLLSNVFFWRSTNYFAGPADLKPLLHTWSLAVEEQFYLFYPLVLCFLRKVRRRKLFAFLLLAGLLSFVISIWGTAFKPAAAFYLLPTRAWELLVGCALAVLPWNLRPSSRRDNAIVTLGILAIVLSVLFYDSSTPFPGIAALPPVLGTGAIIFATANTPNILWCKILAFKPLVFIGLISYSLYLWHWPVIVYTKIYFAEFRLPQAIFALILSLVLSVLSWWFVESPLRRTAFGLTRKMVFGTACGLSGVTILISLLFTLTNGCQWRFPDLSIEHLEDTTWRGNEYRAKISKGIPIQDSDLASLGKRSTFENSNLDFVVWGDSHALCLCYPIDSVASELGLSGKAIAVPSFLPIPGVEARSQDDGSEHVWSEHVDWREQILDYINRRRPKKLILIARWARYLGYSNPYDKGSVHLIDIRDKRKNAESTIILKSKLMELNAFCRLRGIELIVVKQVPESPEPQPAKKYLRYLLGYLSTLENRRSSKSDYETMTARVEKAFDELVGEGIKFIDPSPVLFDQYGRQINYAEGRSLYSDTDHLTRWGTQFLKPALKKLLSGAQKLPSSKPIN